MKNGLFTLVLLLYVTDSSAQSIRLEKSNLNPVTMSFGQVLERKAIRFVKDPTSKEVDEPTFVRVKGIHFTNGTIDVKILSRLLPMAPNSARGFIGVAFRINENNTEYESIYIRPTNGRSDNEVRETTRSSTIHTLITSSIEKESAGAV